MSRPTVEAGRPGSDTMRIAVVGAGPAGLAAAVRLGERGYEDVTIFESADRVGGKAMSVEIDGLHYDLGAVLVNERYPHTLALARKYDVPMFPRTGGRAVVDLETGQWTDLIDALTSRHCPRDYLTAVARAYRYVNKHRKFFDSPGFAFTSCPELEQLRAEIAMPLGEWARVHNMQALLTRWEPAVADMGYGPYASVPAQYALTYMLSQPRVSSRHELWRMVRRRSMPLFSFKRGYQSLFDAIAADHNVVTGSKIERIVRRPGGVSIHIAGCDEPQHFDKVLLAMPLDDAVDLLQDDSSCSGRGDSLRVFKQLEHTDYYATIAESPKLLDGAEFHFSFGSQGLGLAGGHASTRPWPESKLRVFYHFGSPEEPGSADAAVERLRTDLARVGIPLGSIELTQQWRYFPHFSPADVAAGCHDRAERLQGRLNTYFLGGAMAFESIEHTIGYSHRLVDREFNDDSRWLSTNGRTIDLDDLESVAV
jgi:hypothetical protein